MDNSRIMPTARAQHTKPHKTVGESHVCSGTSVIPERFGAVSRGQGLLISRCDYFLSIVNQHGVTFYLITWSDN